MTNLILLSIAALLATGIIGVGIAYLFAPQSIAPQFGLRLPATDPDTRHWLRLKGVRDIASGLLVFTLMLTLGTRAVGLALLALAIIPLGDMSVVLASRGSCSKALFVHGITCLTMLLVGLLLIHVL